MTSAAKQALIVFGKVPTPGHVKTRLVPALRPDDAAALYRAFLLDALELYAALTADVRLYLPPSGQGRAGRQGRGRSELDVARAGLSKIPAGVTVHLQEGEDLGTRMSRSFDETLDAGYQAVVIIGTDHPTLPPAFVDQAFEALQASRTVVLGPARDGGYYLLGANEPVPEAFRDMNYSHDRVLEETIRRLGGGKRRTLLLDEWYDVDTPHDLLQLVHDLPDSPVPAARTRTQLKRLTLQYDWLPAFE